MKTTDPESEWQRLSESYSQMTDEQLEDLASDADSLTDSAHAALKDEVKRRGLKIDSDDIPQAEVEAEEHELVTIRLFRDLPEALLAKSLLESAGIECFLADENMVRLDWFISNAIGNMRLQVDRVDAETAINILDQPVPDDVENSE